MTRVHPPIGGVTRCFALETNVIVTLVIIGVRSHLIKVGKTVFLCVRLLLSTHTLSPDGADVIACDPPPPFAAQAWSCGFSFCFLFFGFLGLITNDRTLSVTISVSLNGVDVMRLKMIIRGSYSLSLGAVSDENRSRLSHHPSVCNVASVLE